MRKVFSSVLGNVQWCQIIFNTFHRHKCTSCPTSVSLRKCNCPMAFRCLKDAGSDRQPTPESGLQSEPWPPLLNSQLVARTALLFRRKYSLAQTFHRYERWRGLCVPNSSLPGTIPNRTVLIRNSQKEFLLSFVFGGITLYEAAFRLLLRPLTVNVDLSLRKNERVTSPSARRPRTSRSSSWSHGWQ